MTALDIINDIKKQIATNRAQFDLLQSLCDRYARLSDLTEITIRTPPATDAPANDASATDPAATAPATPKDPEPGVRNGKPKRKPRVAAQGPSVRPLFEEGSVRSKIASWIGQQRGEWGLDQVKAQFPGVPQGTMSSLIHKLVKIGWCERLRFACYENTDQFGAARATKPAKAIEPSKVERDYLSCRAENPPKPVQEEA